jgi:hypothetical protein
MHADRTQPTEAHDAIDAELEARLDAWGLRQRSDAAINAAKLPPRIAQEVRRAAPLPLRFPTRALLVLAACMAVAALVAVMTLRAPAPSVTVPRASGTDQADVLAARPTLYALMRANAEMDTDNLVLPPSTVVAWTSRVPALQ